MCTVTYLPIPEGFILTQNRDESIHRPRARFPVRQTFGGYQLLFPQDPAGGGTWLAVSDAFRVLSLINGAFKNHPRTLPYRKSRGKVVLEAFVYVEAESFVKHYDFEGIEPFTLLWFARGKIQEVRWDGQGHFSSRLPSDQPRIWSSATLYDPSVQSTRKSWFDDWLQAHPVVHPADILDFHQHPGEKDPTMAINMRRPGGLQTVSIARVVVSSENVQFTYRDLLAGQTRQENQKLRSG